MRKFTIILPVAAILLAALVLTAELSSPLAARTPDAVPVESAKSYDFVDGDDEVSAVTWVETSVRDPDTTKPKLPPPKINKKKKKK